MYRITGTHARLCSHELVESWPLRLGGSHRLQDKNLQAKGRLTFYADYVHNEKRGTNRDPMTRLRKENRRLRGFVPGQRPGFRWIRGIGEDDPQQCCTKFHRSPALSTVQTPCPCINAMQVGVGVRVKRQSDQPTHQNPSRTSMAGARNPPCRPSRVHIVGVVNTDVDTKPISSRACSFLLIAQMEQIVLFRIFHFLFGSAVRKIVCRNMLHTSDNTLYFGCVQLGRLHSLVHGFI